MKFTTEQEAFWAGEFGNAYMERNRGEALLASNLNFYSRALRGAPGLEVHPIRRQCRHELARPQAAAAWH